MSLLTLKNLRLAYGAEPLLDEVELTVEAGERLCLVGRNGSGKSTLMRVLAGEIEADDGEYNTADGLRVARLQQDVPGDDAGSTYEVVAAGLPEAGKLLRRYDQLTRALAEGDDSVWSELEHVQRELDSCDGWTLSQQVDQVLSRMGLDGGTDFAHLSGGMKRRVLLAQALVCEPDLLLLDEPTNHLDIDAIHWLEDFLRNDPATLLFITHDRALIRGLATRIIELDRGRLTSWPGSYDRFLEKKEEALNAEEKQRAEFDKKLAREEQWIRQGIKARRTRNQGRVQELQQMRKEFSQRRERQGKANLEMQDSGASGKKVIEAEGISWVTENGRPLFRDFDISVMRGERIGVLGPNGCGKSTLLRVLLGEQQAQSGSVQLGTKLDIAYFDQLRDTLKLDESVVDNIAEGRDSIEINGRQKHVMAYLRDFLFEPGRARQPVRSLSGGERNRLLLAKLFTQPFNLLVMDEPTNDLDVETLELLEEQLLAFNGTLLLVSHDRAFVDNVVTSTLAFEEDGPHQYLGGYEDWIRHKRTRQPAQTRAPKNSEPPRPAKKPRSSLTYAQELELQDLPGHIENLENQVKALQEEMAEPDFFQQDAETIRARQEELSSRESELADLFERWEELDTQAAGAQSS